MAISMAILSGIVVSVMMVFNGQLSDLIDLYTATVLIHACGLLTMYIVLKVKHISLRDLPHASRFLYLGGVIGVFTVFFNNLTITILGTKRCAWHTKTETAADKAGISAHYFNRNRGDAGMSYIWSIFFALLAGVSIVLSRSVNALLAEKIGALSSSFFNYASGLLASLAFLLLFAPHISPALPQLMKNGNAILLMGGVIGVINIILLNRIVTRIPPLQLTLIVFVAQLASGMLLDYFLLDLFSMRKLIGCSIVVIGLLIHTYAQGKPAA